MGAGAGRRWALGGTGARGDQAGRAGWARRALGARGVGRRRAACSRLGVLLGQQAMHLVHSACFDLVLTQYCS